MLCPNLECVQVDDMLLVPVAKIYGSGLCKAGTTSRISLLTSFRQYHDPQQPNPYLHLVLSLIMMVADHMLNVSGTSRFQSAGELQMATGLTSNGENSTRIWTRDECIGLSTGDGS